MMINGLSIETLTVPQLWDPHSEQGPSPHIQHHTQRVSSLTILLLSLTEDPGSGSPASKGGALAGDCGREARCTAADQAHARHVPPAADSGAGAC